MYIYLTQSCIKLVYPDDALALTTMALIHFLRSQRSKYRMSLCLFWFIYTLLWLRMMYICQIVYIFRSGQFDLIFGHRRLTFTLKLYIQMKLAEEGYIMCRVNMLCVLSRKLGLYMKNPIVMSNLTLKQQSRSNWQLPFLYDMQLPSCAWQTLQMY